MSVKTIAPEDVRLSPSPWVSGQRAVAYFGPTSAVGGTLEDSLLALRRAAGELGATWVVGVEVVVDEARPDEWHASGTAALMVEMG